MKKAKLLLASIAIMGVIGGTLAFNAKREGSPIYTATTTNITAELYSTAALVSAAGLPRYYTFTRTFATRTGYVVTTAAE